MEGKRDYMSKEVGQDLDPIKTARIDALAELEEGQIILRSLLQREARRMKNKLGPDHPRVRRLNSKLQSSLEQISALAVERECLQIKVPDVAEENALVHGRVVDESRRGIAGLMVCLVDHEGVPVQDADEPTTDRSGYFAIALTPDMVDRVIEGKEARVFLAVFTGKRRLVCQQSKPLALAQKARLTEEIYLDRRDLMAPEKGG